MVSAVFCCPFKYFLNRRLYHLVDNLPVCYLTYHSVDSAPIREGVRQRGDAVCYSAASGRLQPHCRWSAPFPSGLVLPAQQSVSVG